jgi:hypothetical protein
MPFCSKCGKEIEGTDKYCNSCGQDIKGGKKFKLKYAGMLLGILLGMIVAALLTVTGDKTGYTLGTYVARLIWWLALAEVPCVVIGFAVGAVIDQIKY